MTDNSKMKITTIAEFNEYDIQSNNESRRAKPTSKIPSISEMRSAEGGSINPYRIKEPSMSNNSIKELSKPQKQVSDLFCTPSEFRGKSRGVQPSANPGLFTHSDFGDMTQRLQGSSLSRNTARKPTSQMASGIFLGRVGSRNNLEPQSVHRGDSRRPRVFAERLEGLKGLVDTKKLQEAESIIVKELVLKGGGDLKSKFKMLDKVTRL